MLHTSTIIEAKPILYSFISFKRIFSYESNDNKSSCLTKNLCAGQNISHKEFFVSFNWMHNFWMSIKILLFTSMMHLVYSQTSFRGRDWFLQLHAFLQEWWIFSSRLDILIFFPNMSLEHSWTFLVETMISQSIHEYILIQS